MQAHWTGSKRCPICESNKWATSSIVALPLAHAVTTGGYAPFFPVTCQVCGHAYWFNAHILWPDGQPPSDAPTDE